MRLRLFLVSAVVGLTGCGYPSDPLPPALNRPVAVQDLHAVERGSKIIVQFTMPKETTEGLPIKRSPEVELRAGIIPPAGFRLAEWERSADLIPWVEGGTNLDAAKYYGSTVAIAVRVKGPRGQNTGWSNFAVLPVVPALATPEALEARDAPDAVQLDWRGAAPQFRVFRKLPDDKEWLQLGTADRPPYTDATIEYGPAYQYRVQAIEKAGDSFAESEISEAITFKPADKFPPAVPAGVTAVAATRTIELLWERNAEKDLAGYRVYRDGRRLADTVASPSYSDKEVMPGARYSYQVSSLDRAGNESGMSAAVEAAIP